MRSLQPIYLFLILGLSLNTIQAQEASEDGFKLYGQVFHKESQMKGVFVHVFIDDSLVYSDKSNLFGKFKLKLKQGYRYRIDFNKEKFITKTVIVNAFTPDGGKISAFAFDVDLVKTRDFRYVEVPEDLGKVAHLYFDKKIEGLIWDKQYTQEALNEIKNYQELNKAKRYEKYSRF
jgi:hypothetical protein